MWPRGGCWLQDEACQVSVVRKACNFHVQMPGSLNWRTKHARKMFTRCGLGAACWLRDGFDLGKRRRRSSTPAVVPGATPALAKAGVGGYSLIYIYIFYIIYDIYMSSSVILNAAPAERHFRFSLAITCSCHPLCSCPMQTSCWSADLCSNGFAWLASWIIAITPYYHLLLLGIPPGLIFSNDRW